MEGFGAFVGVVLLAAAGIGLAIAAGLALAFVGVIAIPASLIIHLILKQLMEQKALVVIDVLIAALSGLIGVVLFLQLREPQTWVGIGLLEMCGCFAHFANQDNQYASK